MYMYQFFVSEDKTILKPHTLKLHQQTILRQSVPLRTVIDKYNSSPIIFQRSVYLKSHAINQKKFKNQKRIVLLKGILEAKINLRYNRVVRFNDTP